MSTRRPVSPPGGGGFKGVPAFSYASGVAGADGCDGAGSWYLSEPEFAAQHGSIATLPVDVGDRRPDGRGAGRQAEAIEESLGKRRMNHGEDLHLAAA